MPVAGDVEQELIAREAERRRALVEDDMAALADLLDDELVHVHATGNVHGKPDVLNHAGNVLRFLDVARGPLRIRSLGPDAAVMTGPMTNTVRRRGHDDESVVVEAFVTQVWLRRNAQWMLFSFHAVRQPPPTP